VRILWQKRHRLVWKRYAKMAFQQLSISALFLSLNLPLQIISMGQLAFSPDWSIQAEQYLFFFSSLIQYLLPFVCLTYLPDKWLKTKTFFALDRKPAASFMNVRLSLAQR
jgi:hypothetical protein